MCNKCHQTNCSCQLSPCVGCVEPDIYVVRHEPHCNTCGDNTRELIQLIRDITGSRPGCNLVFGNAVPVGTTVALSGRNGNGTLEYSSDGNLWQESPVFVNQAPGSRKYFIRERANPACVVAGYVTIAGTPQNWYDTATPPITLCIDGFINNYQTDGLNNYRWNKTNVTCSTGCVPGNTTDVSPQQTQCVNGFLQIRTTNGCTFDWRITSTSCGTTPCTTPSGPSSVSVTPSTCNQSGQMQNNGSFNYGTVANADRYAFYMPGSGNVPSYAQASAVPSNGVIQVSNIAGSSAIQNYKLVLFNGSDSCKLEKDVVVAATICNATCNQPVFTLDSIDATCSSGVTNSDGKLRITGLVNGDRYQICEASSFSCTPDYSVASPISGSAAVLIKSNIGFGSTEQFKDFYVRVYNGSINCHTTQNVRVYNPCYQAGCTFPTNGTPVVTQATCNGTAINNNASVAVPNVANATKYGISYGSTYSGPAYASATAVSGGALSITGLNGSANDSVLSIRLFNGSDSCHKDLLVTITGKNCGVACINPTLTIGSLAPTCSSGISNENGDVSINNIANGNRWQLCNSATFDCVPNYETANPFTGVGPITVVANLGFLANQQYKDFAVRVYNGAVGCYTDRTIRVPNPCYNNVCCSMSITSIQLTNV